MANAELCSVLAGPAKQTFRNLLARVADTGYSQYHNAQGIGGSGGGYLAITYRSDRGEYSR